MTGELRVARRLGKRLVEHIRRYPRAGVSLEDQPALAQRSGELRPGRSQLDRKIRKGGSSRRLPGPESPLSGHPRTPRTVTNEVARRQGERLLGHVSRGGHG